MILGKWRRKGISSDSGLYEEAPSEKGAFFQAVGYKRIVISRVGIYKRSRKLSFLKYLERTFQNKPNRPTERLIHSQ